MKLYGSKYITASFKEMPQEKAAAHTISEETQSMPNPVKKSFDKVAPNTVILIAL